MSFANYTIGATVSIGGKDWVITDARIRKSKTGRNVRVFTLLCEDGKTREATSRAITYMVNGGTGEMSDEQEEREVNGDLARAIADAVEPLIAQKLDEDAVRKIVDAAVANVVPRPVEVIRFDGVKQEIGVQHAHFDALLRAVTARCNCWLVGPAGGGKTSAAEAVATALGLPFYSKSCGMQTTEASLLGFHHAGGETVRTLLREAFEHGGVFLLDEVDAASPAVLVVINALLANSFCAFPDGVVKKHQNFILIAGANTLGMGADRQYVGRQPIDAATLDRFITLDWGYDPRIEAMSAGVPMGAVAKMPVPVARTFLPLDGAEGRCVELVERIVSVRMAVEKMGKGVRFIVSPRASKHGTALIRVGWTVADALEACLWKGLDKDTRGKIEAAAR